MWYCRHEIQLRQALFFSAASIAGAFSGLLAFGISKMQGVGGLEGWRWIFILEGILTVSFIFQIQKHPSLSTERILTKPLPQILVATMAYFVMYDFPETASFLTEEERAFVVFRLKYQGQQQQRNSGETGQQHDGAIIRVAEAEEFQWKYVFAAFKDWQIYASIVVYWGVSHKSEVPGWLLQNRHLIVWLTDRLINRQIVCPLYGISLFLPTIILQLGYTSSTAQLLTVPIYITAAILAVIVAWCSDRVGKRSPFIIGFLCCMLVGFSM